MLQGFDPTGHLDTERVCDLTGTAARTAPRGGSSRSGASRPLADVVVSKTLISVRIGPKGGRVSPVLPARAPGWELPRAHCGRVGGGKGCGWCCRSGFGSCLHARRVFVSVHKQVCLESASRHTQTSACPVSSAHLPPSPAGAPDVVSGLWPGPTVRPVLTAWRSAPAPGARSPPALRPVTRGFLSMFKVHYFLN